MMFESEVRRVLIDIAQAEQKMEEHRQLLNEEIQFNLKELYVAVCGRSPQATAYHLHVFLSEGQSAADVRCLESMIKGYTSCASLNLTFMEFSLIFLSRQNRLLAKLALERDSHGPIPAYLLDYARKILHAEAQLHAKLIDFRQQFSFQAQEWIEKHSCDAVFDGTALAGLSEEMGLEEGLVMRYLGNGAGDSLPAAKMQAIFTLKNSSNIEKYLRSNKGKELSRMDQADPFIRPEFHDCLDRPKTTELFSFREIRSIEKHLDRLNSRNKHELTSKIARFRKAVEKQLVLTCQAITELAVLEKEIEYQRIQLCLCPDFYPVLFFESMERDRAGLLIPSALQTYLAKMSLPLPLNHVYLLFKRFATRPDGKMHFNEFCSMFDVCRAEYAHIEKNREVRGLEDTELHTKKHFLTLLKLIVRNELKAEKIKTRLQRQEVNLRDVFCVFDSNENGCISQLDCRVAWKKFLLMDLPPEQIQLFWHRMRLSPHPDTLLKYERFVSELIPRCKWVQHSSKTIK